MQDGPTFVEEQKHITILFSDLVDSTGILESLEPEEAVDRLNDIIAVMRKAIRQYGGLVNYIEGDGLMALFGAPVAQEDHALCACKAALELHDKIRSEFGSAMRVRTGLCSGNAILRLVETDVLGNYDATGLSVVLARRMQEIAAAGEILTCGDLPALVESEASIVSLGGREIKGFVHPVEVCQLTGLRDAPRATANAKYLGATFVGREAELAVLQEAVAGARRGQGQVITVTAGPGFGKSRMVRHFLDTADTTGFQTIEVAADRQDQRTTYRQITQFLKALLDPEEDGSAGLGHMLRTAASLDLGLESIQPALASLLNPEDDGNSSWRALDPVQQRGQVFEAFERLIAAASDRQPLIAVFEDVHWMDAGSMAVLENLVAHLKGFRVVLILTLRPERAIDWQKHADQINLQLPPLGRHDFDTLAVALLGKNASSAQITSELYRKAGGVPLFLEELIRSLSQLGVLEGTHGRYRLTGLIDTSEVPPRIQNVLASRIDGLSTKEKSVLQAAAVLGTDISVAVLQAVADVSQNQTLDGILKTLVDGRFLRQLDRATDTEFSFEHELTREVTYLTMLRKQRKQLHGRAFEAIVALRKPRLDAHLDRLADHAYQAEDWANAGRFYLAAMARSVRHWANRDAIATLESGIAALERVPPSREKACAEIDFRLLACSALTPLGRQTRALELLEEARNIAVDYGEDDRHAAINCQLAAANWRLGAHLKGLEHARSAIDLSRRIGNTGLELAGRYNLGMIAYEVGDYNKAVTELCTALDLLTPEYDQKHPGWPSIPSVSINAFLASAFLEMGQVDRAEAVASDATARADAARHPYTQTMAYVIRARIHAERGELKAALSAIELVFDLSKRFQIDKMYAFAASILIEIHLASGKIDSAIGVFERPEINAGFDGEDYFGRSHLALAKGQALLAANRLESAQDELESCLALVTFRGEWPKAALCNWSLSELHSRRGLAGTEQARSYRENALQIARRIGFHLLPDAVNAQVAP